MSKTVKQIVIGALLGALLLSAFGGLKFIQIQRASAGHGQGPPPQAVTSAKAQESEWEQFIPTVGELAPIRGADLAFQTSGVISKTDFTPGTEVEKGTLLAQLDVSVEQAELGGREAELKLAEQEYARYQKLLKNKATSRSEFEKRLSEYRAQKSEVDSLRSTINRRTIIAPFGGTLGTQKMALGEFVKEGESVVSLVDLSELYVNFTVPARYTLSVNIGDDIRFQTESVPEKTFKAQITSIESIVASNTRNISLQAKTLNAANLLRPGMFVEVKILRPEVQKVITIPASSIQYAPYGNTVFVIQSLKGKDDLQYTGVLPRNVRLGEQRGDQISIISGLTAGEEIVSSGTFKLFPTAPVAVNNSVMPSDSLTPNPPTT